MHMSPAALVRRSRIGMQVSLPAAALVVAVQGFHLSPLTVERPHLVVMVFLSLLAGSIVSAMAYIAGRCMLCAADAFGAGYRLHQHQQEQQPARLTVVE